MNIYISKILENNNITEKIYRMIVEFDKDIKPGQFFMLKTLDNSFLLPRPISVNDVGNKTVTFLYRVEGIGTSKISSLKCDDTIQIFGPLGNGFDIKTFRGNIAIIGGGIGTAPLLYLTKSLGNRADVYLGFKDRVFMENEFKKYSDNVIVATEDGNKGLKGYITEFINLENYDTVVTCGPEIMMHIVAGMCKEKNIKCYVSLERRMACGMGACLGCTVKTINGNKRACKDGPIFLSDELI